MLHSLSKILLGTVCALSLASCGDSKHEPETPDQPAKRTVLIYMVATNNLGGRFDRLDLEEMQAAAVAGFPDRSRLIVYYASNDSTPRLMEITPHGRKILKVYSSDIKSVTAERMTEVIADTKLQAQAERYGMMFWSHASGWLEDGIEEPEPTTLYSFGFDGQSRFAMNTTTLARVLEGKGIDFAYFDCCYMGGVEVAYQLRNAVQTIVASSAELPANGSPYDKILPYLMRGQADCIAAARVTYEDYQALYDLGLQGDDSGCTLSVVNTSALGPLADAVRELYLQHPVLPDVEQVQEFQNNRRNYYDLGDYLDKLRLEVSSPADSAATELVPLDLTRFRSALADAVPYAASTPAIHMTQKYPVKAFCGLSTYILRTPSSSDYLNYCNLAWYSDVARYIFPDIE